MKSASGIKLSMRVWDTPLRLFHAFSTLLAALLALAWYEGWKEPHRLAAEGLLVLLLFRIGWGVAGSETARFSAFLVAPLSGVEKRGQRQSAANRAPVRTSPRGGPASRLDLGHGAAGGWLMLVMLLVMLAACLTGLCASPAAPFYWLLPPGAAAQAPLIHSAALIALGAVFGLYILMLAIAGRMSGESPLRQFITGKKRLPAATPAPRLAGLGAGGLVFLCALLLVVLLVRQFGA